VDADSLTEILSGRHFSMPERISRGLWPHEPMRLGDLVRHLSGVIRSRPWFPALFCPAAPGEVVADVTTIERRGPHEYIVHVQRSGASGFTIAATGSSTFTSAEAAAAEFLRQEFRLPGDLDGWTIVE
jgi:hypothetical protein